MVMRAAVYPAITRNLHFSPYRRLDSKATFATVAPGKSASTKFVPSPASAAPQQNKQQSTELTSDSQETHMEGVQEKRDFFWTHPVYTRSEYEKIQVRVMGSNDANL